MKNPGTTKISAKTVATVGMLCAIAFVANLISQVFPTVSGFLSFDLKDVVIVIGGFMMGPVTAIVISVIVSLIEMLTVSSTGVIGLIMNILSSCAFACLAAGIYHRDRSMKGAIIGLVAGILCMTAIMLLWNWLITPLYMHIPREQIEPLLLTAFLPFNLLKSAFNTVLTVLLYKSVVSALRAAKLVPKSNAPVRRGIRVSVLLTCLFCLVTLILILLVWRGIL